MELVLNILPESIGSITLPSPLLSVASSASEYVPTVLSTLYQGYCFIYYFLATLTTLISFSKGVNRIEKWLSYIKVDDDKTIKDATQEEIETSISQYAKSVYDESVREYATDFYNDILNECLETKNDTAVSLDDIQLEFPETVVTAAAASEQVPERVTIPNSDIRGCLPPLNPTPPEDYHTFANVVEGETRTRQDASLFNASVKIGKAYAHLVESSSPFSPTSKSGSVVGLYIIRINVAAEQDSNKEKYMNPAIMWDASVRFSSFVTLVSQMKTELKKTGLRSAIPNIPELPPKTILKDTSQALIDSRKASLQVFLNIVTSDSKLASLNCFREFCEIN